MPRETFPAYVRTTLTTRIPLAGFLDQAGAVTFLASLVIPFKAALERAVFIPDVVGAGAGATQGIQIRKGGATGPVIATVTPTLANHALGGAGVVGTVAAAD